MKYFSVNKEELIGTLTTGEICSDGEYVNLPDDIEQRTLTMGYSVSIYEENGMIEDTKYYPVNIDTESWTTNEDEVLEKIKADFPAGEWQNNNW